MAVGTVTVTPQAQLDKARRPCSKYTIAWVADASGNVSGTLTGVISGEVLRVVFDPGTPAPTANYDIVLNDESGLDILAAQGANLSATATTHVCPGVPLKDGVTTSVRPVVIDGTLELQVSNAGSGGAGQVIVYVR